MSLYKALHASAVLWMQCHIAAPAETGTGSPGLISTGLCPADPRQGWTGPYLVLTDGLAFNGSTWSPEMEACAPDGCLGDTPALGIDKHGLWCAPISQLPPQAQRRQREFIVNEDCLMGTRHGKSREHVVTDNLLLLVAVLPLLVSEGKEEHLAMK